MSAHFIRRINMISPGIYLPADMDNNDSVDASESARIYSRSDACSSLNEIHARMMVQQVRKMLENSFYGFTEPHYHMGDEIIMDYQDKLTPDSHCYEYEYQSRQQRYKSLERLWEKLAIKNNLKKPFSITINTEVNNNETT